MQGARAPWWVFAVAAGVLGYFVLNVYAELLGPGAIGVDLRYRDGRAVVVPDFPAARAGIGPGDVTASSMAEVVRNTTSQLTADDLTAMIRYLRSLPPLVDEPG